MLWNKEIRIFQLISALVILGSRQVVFQKHSYNGKKDLQKYTFRTLEKLGRATLSELQILNKGLYKFKDYLFQKKKRLNVSKNSNRDLCGIFLFFFFFPLTFILESGHLCRFVTKEYFMMLRFGCMNEFITGMNIISNRQHFPNFSPTSLFLLVFPSIYCSHFYDHIYTVFSSYL